MWWLNPFFLGLFRIDPLKASKAHAWKTAPAAAHRFWSVEVPAWALKNRRRERAFRPAQLQPFVLTHFLDANRRPFRLKMF